MAASFCRRSFLNYKNHVFHTHIRTGYVVLIPETSKEVAECNVISLENLPDFSKLDTEICKQIVNKYAQQYEVGSFELDEHLKKVLSESKKIDVFKHIIEPLEVLTVPFLSSWGVAKTLYVGNQKVMPLSSFDSLLDRVLQIRTDKFNINSIYTACKNQLENDEDKCTEEQKRILKKFLWEGFHNGFELSESDKKDLKKCHTNLENKKRKYESKLKNSIALFKQIVYDKSIINECPVDLLRNTAVNSLKPYEGPWIITLKDFVYYRFIEHCNSREARRHIWYSYNQICSKHLDSRCNAMLDIEDYRQRRSDFAKKMGFQSYAHLSMKTKMAGSVENVQNVLSTLLEPAKHSQEKELYELEKFAYSKGSTGRIEKFDYRYWKRMERKDKYGLDEAVLLEYFPLSQVLLGLIALCEQLFGIEIQEQPSLEAWHPDVRYFRVIDEKTKNLLGGFYLDPYARPDKMVGEQNTGNLVTIRPRSKICASLPLSSIILSFTPPTEDKPCLLFYREVQVLFERFAQMLQFTLTQMNYSEVSGSSNIEWDAVDICNEFLKCWLSDRTTLESISGHYNTGEPLPSHLLDNLSNVHKHLAGTDLSKQIYLSNLDLELHLQDKNTLDIARELWSEHLLFEFSPLDYHPYGFKEIFVYPWGASYYSFVWSKMVAADAFAAFAEVGLSNQEEISALGKRFRSTFLSLGGGCDPAEVFRKFRGRDPNPRYFSEFLNLHSSPTLSPNETPEIAIATDP